MKEMNNKKNIAIVFAPLENGKASFDKMHKLNVIGEHRYYPVEFTSTAIEKHIGKIEKFEMVNNWGEEFFFEQNGVKYIGGTYKNLDPDTPKHPDERIVSISAYTGNVKFEYLIIRVHEQEEKEILSGMDAFELIKANAVIRKKRTLVENIFLGIREFDDSETVIKGSYEFAKENGKAYIETMEINWDDATVYNADELGLQEY